MSAYRIAIDQTTKTIDSRARYFRNLVVAVVVLTLGSIGGAVLPLGCVTSSTLAYHFVYTTAFLFHWKLSLGRIYFC